MSRIKPLIFISFLFITLSSLAQVGISNTAPEAALDVTSTDSGILIPRVALTSTADITTVTNPNGVALVESTLIYNDGTGGLTPAGFYYWNGSEWSQLRDGNPSVYFGKEIVSSAGTVSITGVGFTPSVVEFIAVNRVQGYDEAGRSGTNNSNDIRMAGGFTTGYARNDSGSIDQQVISSAFNGSSINNIGTYSSDNHCIAAYYVNNNGERLHDNGNNSGDEVQEGLVRASLQSFDSDGFTLNFDRFISGADPRTNALVIIYKAYR